MEKILEQLFDFKKIPTKFIVVVLLSSAFILFVPNHFLSRLNLDGFLQDFGKYIGISFILSFGFTTISLWTFFAKIIYRYRLSNKIKKEIVKDLFHLDFHEKALLREFYLNGKSTLQLPIDNDTVVGLINKNIIYQASSTGFTYSHGAYFPFSISNIARENITNQILELPEEITQADEKKIIDSRPNWAKERSYIDSIFNSKW